MKFLNVMDRVLGGRSSLQLAFIGFILILLVGMADYFTGYELSFSLFYLLPIAPITWYSNKYIGYSLCLTSATVWVIVDSTSGMHPTLFVGAWNASVRLGFFTVIAYLLTTLKGHLSTEQLLSRTDSLTKIYNARAFEEIARPVFQLASRHRRQVALAYIDIDNFKAVNDSFGHSEGDLVLKTVAKTLAASLRATDIVARMGGDEFVVLMPESDYSSARTAVARFHKALMQEVVPNGWPITFSIGVAVFGRIPATMDEAIHITDHLMYQAKNSGKDRVVYWENGGNKVWKG